MNDADGLEELEKNSRRPPGAPPALPVLVMLSTVAVERFVMSYGTGWCLANGQKPPGYASPAQAIS